MSQRKGSGRSDILTHIAESTVKGRPITDREATNLASQVMVGGLDTVVNFLSYTMLTLAGRPDLQRRIAENPGAVANFANELLRRLPIVSSAREVVGNVQVDGVSLRDGDMVVAPTPLYSLSPTIHKHPMEIEFDRPNRFREKALVTPMKSWVQDYILEPGENGLVVLHTRIEFEPPGGAPVANAGKFIAIGLNYSDHAKEAGMAIPSEPIVFMKATTCISGPNDDVIQPKHSTKLDWECELGIVIGTQAKYVSVEDALNYVAGYCVVNDVSERAFQLATTQWDKGKGFDTAGPIGPWLVTTDEITDPQNLDMYLDLNGKRMQTGNTRTMIFSCAQIVSHVSQYMTLLPGDIIACAETSGLPLSLS